MRAHFALVGGAESRRKAIARLLGAHGHLAVNVEDWVNGGRWVNRDDWFHHALPLLHDAAVFETDDVVIEDVLFDDEARIVRAMGVRIVHCGRSFVMRRPDDLVLGAVRVTKEASQGIKDFLCAPH